MPFTPPGGPAELKRLLVTHSTDIEAIVRRYVDDEMDRDDLRQEIAIAVWRAMPRFLGQSAERTYIVRIAQNRAITFRLRLARNRAVFHPLDNEEAAVGSHSGEYDLRRMHGQIIAAVATLPTVQQRVLTLSAAGYSPQQIATRIGRSSGAIRVALHRAREAVRRCIGIGGSQADGEEGT